jgi:hypothetical protein
VFARVNNGFDAIVGNPPFLGGRRISSEFGNEYVNWLGDSRKDVHGNADLVAHFLRRAYELIRTGGAFGLIATKTIGQGETRITGLAPILVWGGTIYRAVRRLRWPGDAAVVVSVVHIEKSTQVERIIKLDTRPVRRISAYLVEGDLDSSPERLSENLDSAFQGSILLGKGFVFDDQSAERGLGPSLAIREALIKKNRKNSTRIFPYLGGEDVNTDPRQIASRYVIDFENMTLARAREDWPELVDNLERYVKPERAKQKRVDLRQRWWQFAYRKNGLYEKIGSLTHVIVCSQATKHIVFVKVPSKQVFDQKVIVIARDDSAAFCHLTCRAHSVWVESFASTLGETLNYSTGICFETFPFPRAAASSALDNLCRSYHDHRAALMVARNEGMTKTYNRFHDRSETAEDIRRLRELHAGMDRAVLEAYGWHDLAARAAPVFLDETNEDDHTYQGRLFWPSDFRDEVLARLLGLNAERHAEEVRLGIAPGMKVKGRIGDEEDEFEDG